ncbi:MAG TPA: hypothetical protein VHD83_26190 [Puia sp.]|nr:hypothetical protein [Puia sp.]
MKHNKKIIGFFIGMLALFTVNGQVTFSPASFTPIDSVTLVVDVTGTPMAGATEAYIWIFSNISGGGKDGFTNTAWNNSPPSAKMKNVGTNKWQFGFVGTTMFGQAPGELKDFGFLVKSQTGSSQTPDYKPYKFDQIVFTPTVLRVFPSKVDLSDVVTLNFDQTLSTDINEQRMTPTTATVGIYKDSAASDGPHYVQVGSDITLPVRKTSDQHWSASFIPSSSFSMPAGVVITRFRYKFHGTVLDNTGAPSNVASSEGEQLFTSMK